jgi:predicted translin family RNA/ssDNA-binding protein
MLNKNFLKQLNKNYKNHESERRQIISLSNVILHNSKRAIFSMHRGDIEKTKESLSEIEKLLKDLSKKFGTSRIEQEGSYRASVEEYVEAKMFFNVVSGKKIDKFNDLEISTEGYIGGLCDLTGELVRQAVNKASQGKIEEAKKAKEIIEDIMAELVEFDMTGYLRTKYDQARSNVKKIEQINYEISLRK